METSWNSLIGRAISRRPDALVDVTLWLWEKLAVELVSLIGDGGFQAIYVRSSMLAAKRYPWLAQNSPLKQTDFQVAGLRSRLEGRDIMEVREASILLLSTFLDILTSLIGETMVTNLLHSAWGDDVLTLNDKNC
ncbi:hypothetical protein SAMN06295970_1377 [Noviherbaspirillum suwonense]|jgi:hypothetical protein|uniref:TetR family transcriptional regulator n=1 Tax=Noviherbaspirillum suwonense TaxID=1224511 RepID=A0ABY1QUH9_9BURK|nr:hypothetical protein SAMN06295970_1377 [Noviherbaspirillum suwonense]